MTLTMISAEKTNVKCKNHHQHNCENDMHIVKQLFMIFITNRKDLFSGTIMIINMNEMQKEFFHRCL